MEQHDRGAVAGTFVDIVHAQRSGVAGGNIDIMRFERITLETGESAIGRAQDVHADPSKQRRVVGVRT